MGKIDQIVAEERAKIARGEYTGLRQRSRPAAAARAAAPRTAAPPQPTAVPQPKSRATVIAELCRDAGKPALAADLILAGATLEQARHALAVESWRGPLLAAQNAVN